MNCIYCFSSCKPRYRRLVDSIYPRTLKDGLISGNMHKLTFYSISHPEKLNRIGIYLVNRLSRDLYRQKFFEVKIAVDAMTQLLKSCHGSPSLNQFIESYLKMVQKLLETNDSQMEKFATDLFVGFSTIEEDSPSYHRQYDFFISKFSSMCHSSNEECSKSQRYDGLRGLRGVIWKSASDDLQANIWEKQHMNKIIPSILFNFQEEEEEMDEHFDPGTSMLFHHYPSDTNAEDTRSLALQCLRELYGKCNFGSLKSVLEPVFKHFDLHKKWDPPATFAVTTFKAILCSIQAQNSSFVIQELINHLEQMPNVEIYTRIGIATVLSSIVSIAGTTIGPVLLAIFNSLLKRLRSSVEFQQSKQCINLEAEKTFQDTLINALGDFANALPDYQKLEIMTFTMGNISIVSDEDQTMKKSDAFLQKVLVKTILKVATKYKTCYLATVFTDSFLNTLLQLSVSNNSEVRILALHIFHTLLDRHDNLPKLKHLPFVIDVLKLVLTIEKCSRQDQLFIRRHIQNIISMLYRNVVLVEESEHLNNNIDAVLCSMALLCIEVGHDENLIELFRLAFALQSFACEIYSNCSQEKVAAIHNLVAKYLNFSSQLLAIPTLCNHIQQVIKIRAQRGHPLLNITENSYNKKQIQLKNSTENEKSNDSNKQKTSLSAENKLLTPTLKFEANSEFLFDLETVAEALKTSNKDLSGLNVPLKTMVNYSTTILSNQVENSSNISSVSGSGRPKSAASLKDGELLECSRDNTTYRSPDQSSIDSSSIDWSPPESRQDSRKNTVFNMKFSKELSLPITIKSLKTINNVPPNLSEEESFEKEKSLQILNSFRNKKSNELMQFFSQTSQKESDETPVEANVDDLVKTLRRLNSRNLEWSKMVEFGHNLGSKENIFNIKFPSFFVK